MEKERTAMKGTILKRFGQVFIPFLMVMLIGLLQLTALAAKKTMMPTGILFEQRQITDPQFGGAVAATVNLPKGWSLEAKAN